MFCIITLVMTCVGIYTVYIQTHFQFINLMHQNQMFVLVIYITGDKSSL